MLFSNLTSFMPRSVKYARILYVFWWYKMPLILLLSYLFQTLVCGVAVADHQSYVIFCTVLYEHTFTYTHLLVYVYNSVNRNIKWNRLSEEKWHWPRVYNTITFDVLRLCVTDTGHNGIVSELSLYIPYILATFIVHYGPRRWGSSSYIYTLYY